MKKAALLTLTLGLATVLLAGCAPATTGGGTGNGGSSGSGSSGSGSGSGSSASGPTTKIDVCSILPAAKASSASGQNFTAAKPIVLNNGIYSCAYTPDSGYNWSVTIYEPSAHDNLDSLTIDLGGQSSVKSLSGVGDKAVISGVGVAAAFGNDLIEVAYPTTPDNTDNRDAYIALAKAAIAAAG